MFPALSLAIRMSSWPALNHRTHCGKTAASKAITSARSLPSARVRLIPGAGCALGDVGR